MPWNLLILPLLGGFWFLRTCNLFRFRSQYLEGYRLLMESAIATVFLTSLGRLITSLIAQVPWGRALEDFCREALPFPFVGTTVSAFLIGLLALFPINRWLVHEKQAKRRAVEVLNDPLIRLLYEAAESRKPVFVTLDSRKVYVGFVLRAPNLERENLHLGLLPLLSGYRNPTTLRTHFSVDYIAVYESGEVDANDFAIVIPLVHISSAHFFDLNVYAQFFLKNSPPKADSVERPSGG